MTTKSSAIFQSADLIHFLCTVTSTDIRAYAISALLSTIKNILTYLAAWFFLSLHPAQLCSIAFSQWLVPLSGIFDTAPVP